MSAQSLKLTALERRPDAVPLSDRIEEDGEPVSRARTWRCETVDVRDPAERLRRAFWPGRRPPARPLAVVA